METEDIRGIRELFASNRVMLGLFKEFTVTTFQTFLGIAMWGYREKLQSKPLTIRELSSRIGLNYMTTSRHIRYLGDGSNDKPGLGLMQTLEWPLDRRQKTVSLTQKGLDIISQLSDLVGKELPSIDDEWKDSVSDSSGSGFAFEFENVPMPARGSRSSRKYDWSKFPAPVSGKEPSSSFIPNVRTKTLYSSIDAYKKALRNKGTKEQDIPAFSVHNVKDDDGKELGARVFRTK